MTISTLRNKVRWDPVSEAERGSLLFRVQGATQRGSGRVDGLPFFGDNVWVAPKNEGSRTGDGTPLSDPYAYENDGVSDVDYRPLVVPGVLPGKNALGFVNSGGGGTLGAFVDDPNTGVASQAPDKPGKLMVLSRDRQGSDYGLFSNNGANGGGIKQPKTLVMIARFSDVVAAFGPALELNSSVLTGVGGERGDLFLVQGYRITANGGGTGTPWTLTLDVPPAVNEWYTLIWRLDVGAPIAYEGLTGAPRAATLAGGVYDPDLAVINDPAVHCLGGRRYSFAGATPADFRTRNFSSLHVQEIIGIDRLVEPARIATWIKYAYPGIEDVAVF